MVGAVPGRVRVLGATFILPAHIKGASRDTYRRCEALTAVGQVQSPSRHWKKHQTMPLPRARPGALVR